MFGWRKKKEIEFVAPVDGKCIPIETVEDNVFSSKMMGDGFAMIPTGTVISAPTDGKIVMLANTLHAFGMKTKSGIELLVHIGLDTVNLNGQGFKALSKVGTYVKAGTPVVEIDREFMESHNVNLTTMVIITEGYDKEIQLSQYNENLKMGAVLF